MANIHTNDAIQIQGSERDGIEGVGCLYINIRWVSKVFFLILGNSEYISLCVTLLAPEASRQWVLMLQGGVGSQKSKVTPGLVWQEAWKSSIIQKEKRIYQEWRLKDPGDRISSVTEGKRRGRQGEWCRLHFCTSLEGVGSLQVSRQLCRRLRPRPSSLWQLSQRAKVGKAALTWTCPASLPREGCSNSWITLRLPDWTKLSLFWNFPPPIERASWGKSYQ